MTINTPTGTTTVSPNQRVAPTTAQTTADRLKGAASSTFQAVKTAVSGSTTSQVFKQLSDEEVRTYEEKSKAYGNISERVVLRC